MDRYRNTRRSLRWRVFLLLLTGGVAVHASAPPSWWDDPIRESHGHYFFPGSGTSPQSAAEALERAQRNALQQIARQVAGAGAAPELTAYALANVRNWGLHERFERRESRTYYAWVLVRYPITEYKELERYVAGGRTRFQEALQMAGAGRHEDALQVFNELITAYPVDGQPVLPTDEALLVAAESAVAAGRHGLAMNYFQQLMDLGPEHTAFNRAREGYIQAQNLHDPLMEGMIPHRGRTFAVWVEWEGGDGTAIPHTATVAESLVHYGLRDKTGVVGLARPFEVLLEPDATLPDVDVVVLARMAIGTPTERTAFGTPLSVYPVTCRINLLSRGEDEVVERRQLTRVTRVSDRHGAMEVVQQNGLRALASLIIAEMIEMPEPRKGKEP